MNAKKRERSKAEKAEEAPLLREARALFVRQPLLHEAEEKAKKAEEKAAMDRRLLEAIHARVEQRQIQKAKE